MRQLQGRKEDTTTKERKDTTNAIDNDVHGGGETLEPMGLLALIEYEKHSTSPTINDTAQANTTEPVIGEDNPNAEPAIDANELADVQIAAAQVAADNATAAANAATKAAKTLANSAAAAVKTL